MRLPHRGFTSPRNDVVPLKIGIIYDYYQRKNCNHVKLQIGFFK
ncbi:hypothetical protein RFEPED_0697 [Rickettsia felis str. Pedreira]|uniref:Uncharacterized protein n=1 Tax=Rickettsia felis str. Pedreira TaxID=1359196 RepID=A0A0F3MS92_RICFI|nr:hypothetical protein RFEPED_0697 [Rickettsia felis str. Pedreira]